MEAKWSRLHPHGLGRTEVAGENDVVTRKVFPFAGRQGDRGVIQNLKEEVEDEWVRLLHFIEEQRAPVGAGERVTEQAVIVGMRDTTARGARE